ncbi:MAG TPA: methyltransferase [Hyphomicrobiaceae bacterium]|jgi:protein-S-isoprenylcysteine O-methyltransferase Ste14
MASCNGRERSCCSAASRCWRRRSSTWARPGASASRRARRRGWSPPGLYRFCRHPIYLGLLIALAGYAALLPTPLSLALLAAAYAGARAQAAAEEAYLGRTYGEAFRGYARRTGRFLPGVGRL